MCWGAKLCLNTEEEKHRFKIKINNNTKTGSVCESGDHLRGHIQPMCDYDTQSVINVLKNEILINNDADVWGEGHESSKRIQYYHEEWNW